MLILPLGILFADFFAGPPPIQNAGATYLFNASEELTVQLRPSSFSSSVAGDGDAHGGGGGGFVFTVCAVFATACSGFGAGG